MLSVDGMRRPEVVSGVDRELERSCRLRDRRGSNVAAGKISFRRTLVVFRELMLNLDSQLDYWNTEGVRKPFAHPLNLHLLTKWLSQESRVLDYGCGYGRCLGELFNVGYRN